MGARERFAFLVNNFHVFDNKATLATLVLTNATLEWRLVFDVNNLIVGLQMLVISALVVTLVTRECNVLLVGVFDRFVHILMKTN